MRSPAPCSLTFGIAFALVASTTTLRAANPAPAAAVSESTKPVYDISELDARIPACADFNGYANSRWITANPIPADRTRWGASDQLREQSLDAQHKLVDVADAGADAAPANSIAQKLGWLYRSGMNERAIDKAGFKPIKPDLAAIDKIKDARGIAAWLASTHARGQGQGFQFGSSADYKNAKRQIAFARQDGLGLPTPDYYTLPEHADIRAAYVKYIAQLFVLTGEEPAKAQRKADGVLGFETRLAQASLSPLELRDPANQYRFMTVAEADKVMPHFDWNAFFQTLSVQPGEGFSLSQPRFFAEFDAMLTTLPASQWRDYLAFHTIDDASVYLARPFQDANFAFYQQTLRGQPQQRVRWKRVLDTVNDGMGEALGQLYVNEHFPPQAKARAQQLVDNVRNALKTRIERLDWMSAPTKAKALEKWATFLPKIGYPDTWRGWDELKIVPNDYYANVRAAQAFNARYDFDKIGKPTNRKDWGMTPQTVNAYYEPTDNTINFPAAILQPPYFYADGDDAINYGGIGAVIGHEASHGFDDEGSQFDAAGNNIDWWTATDRERFNARTAKLGAQFDGYVPLPDHPQNHVNGKLTMGENIADLAGLNVAYDALQKADGGTKDPMIDGLARDQRFFLSWARVWRGNIRDKAQLVQLNSDPHSPAKFRAIGAPSNMPAFAKAFQCKAGDTMVRPDDAQAVIW